jgi:hypothetical protein
VQRAAASDSSRTSPSSSTHCTIRRRDPPQARVHSPSEVTCQCAVWQGLELHGAVRGGIDAALQSESHRVWLLDMQWTGRDLTPPSQASEQPPHAPVDQCTPVHWFRSHVCIVVPAYSAPHGAWILQIYIYLSNASCNKSFL